MSACTGGRSEQVWARLAMLPRDFGRWPVPSRENITVGQGPEDDASVDADAHAVSADTVLNGLPYGLDTNLAPSWWGGRDLSNPRQHSTPLPKKPSTNASAP
ncbi:hypothetical protein ACFRR7_35450 [Streptomyces sp. NPDC056909]|uniref:hypothetical protein n=1 Tax=Streptomyces sp. NPDC056909 TaxID=3345963 RepID=UPI003694C4E0